MSRGDHKRDCKAEMGAPTSIVPAGTPEWITAELIEKTIQVWQPYYNTPLATDDAVEIIRNVGRLFDTISTRSPATSNAERSPESG
jgi:hypothetical protein